MSNIQPLAIITGGTSGIGLATARRLYSDYRLALIYGHDGERAMLAEAEFGDLDRAKAFRVDVGSPDSIDAGYPSVLSHFGEAPQALVCSAGISRPQRFFIQSVSFKTLEELMNVNYFGTVRMVHKVIQSMYSRRQGAIVNVSSISAQGGYKGFIGYAESKAAIECFTRNLAVEVGHRGIRVNCVCPGLVRTIWPGNPLEQLNSGNRPKNAPLGRMIEADEVARVIEHLLASPAINGANIVVDGATSVLRG
jgi:NAD(P)-dependent dehydrogenase (short-subunit alcohol dehydrogenase family)